jgi:hypothetical protein
LQRISKNHCSIYSIVARSVTLPVDNRELLQCGVPIASTKDTASGGGSKFLPSLLGMLRSPVRLTIAGNSVQGQALGVGASSAQCAMFPFLTKLNEYEVLCTLGNGDLPFYSL